jgi:hypothetical protein
LPPALLKANHRAVQIELLAALFQYPRRSRRSERCLRSASSALVDSAARRERPLEVHAHEDRPAADILATRQHGDLKRVG